MSSQEPIVIDPETPSGLECLLAAALIDVTDVPKDVWSRLPAETVPVSSLLKANIPDCLSNTSIMRAAHLCFSPLDPHWTIDELFKTPLPSRSWLDSLEINLSKMWGSGTCSIVPPQSPNPDLWFPLWVVNFWNTAVEVAEQRDKWRAAEGWLSGRMQDSGVREARGLLEKIPWGLRLWSLTGHDKVTRVGHLAGLLSNEWLGERHIDTVSSCLDMRAQREPGSRPTILIAGADLNVYLSYSSGATIEAVQAHSGLGMYAKQISDHNYSRVFIPALVGRNHWIVFSVDFEKYTFEYGELALLRVNNCLPDALCATR